MTDDQWQYMDRYVRDVADQMTLKDWRISLLRDPCADDCNADVQSLYGKREARIRICLDFTEKSGDEQRRIITHELTHVHIDPTLDVLFRLQPHVGSVPYAMACAQQKETIEFGVDALSRLIAPAMPMCELPKGGD